MKSYNVGDEIELDKSDWESIKINFSSLVEIITAQKSDNDPSATSGSRKIVPPTQATPPAPLFFCTEDRILGSLGHPELDHTLSRDFDRRTGLRIPSRACLAVRQDELPNPRYHKAVLRFLLGQRREVVQQFDGGLLRQPGLLSHVLGDLRLRQ